METLLVETRNAVRTLTMNRPERLNAVNDDLSTSLIEEIERASKDDEVRVVVITGKGRGFCAGLDLTDAAKRDKSKFTRHRRLDDLGWVGQLVYAIVECDKPVIAAINGVAAGAGLAFTLACDLRYMNEEAKVTTGYIRRGLNPDAGLTYYLPRLVGQGKATELTLTARDVYGEEAERIGLINGIFKEETFMEEVTKIAENLAEMPPIAMTYSKRLLQASPESDLDTILKREYALIQNCFKTEDVQEGIKAFQEKRKPQFIGK